jgi:biopolymer transport protein ExbD
MRFKSQSHSSELPEVNLVPMMDVLLTVLTFFIVIAMTMSMSNQRSLDILLPNGKGGSDRLKPPNPLMVGLTVNGELFIDRKPITQEQMKQEIQAYLGKNPNGAVILSADRKLPYENVMKVLGEMEDLGGDRVSLAIGS